MAIGESRALEATMAVIAMKALIKNIATLEMSGPVFIL